MVVQREKSQPNCRKEFKTHVREWATKLDVEIVWLGVRPLQMRDGPKRGSYRVGFDAYSGMSRISAADCAHAMVAMLSDDTWIHRAPIIQY